MGQHFILVNKDKKEWVSPNRKTGEKFHSWCQNYNEAGLIAFLLRQSDEGGGGDIEKEYQTAGRWVGDRVVLVGDYDSSDLYQTAKDNYTNISDQVIEEYTDFTGPY